MRRIFLFTFVLILLVPSFVFAEYEYVDLSITRADIVLGKSTNNLIEADRGRVYASVYNSGTADGTGLVVFSISGEVIGTSGVSSKSGGVYDEVFVDFIMPVTDFSVLVQIVNVDPTDTNISNNEALSAVFHVQTDIDLDGLGEDVDTDDDGDGLEDSQEATIGTNKDVTDTDGDGIIDSEDDFPLDPNNKKEQESSKQENELDNQPVVTPQPEQSSGVELTIEVEDSEPSDVLQNDDATSEEDEVEQELKEGLSEAYYQSGKVDLLKNVEIKATQLNWNTFDFSLETNVPNLDLEKLEFSFDFGDGKKGEQIGTHKFTRLGSYLVDVKVKGPWGNYLYDTVKVQVSFWSVYNYWLWMIVFGIILVIFLYSFGSRGKKRKKTRFIDSDNEYEEEDDDEYIQKLKIK